MGNIDELISNIDSRRRNPKNTELWEFIKGSLEQIKEINESDKKYYQGTEEAPAMFKIIEEKYQKIKDEFDKLFLPAEEGKNQSQIIQEKIDEIKKYHTELLTNENSIKSDIEDSQKHITDFYNYLFSSENDQEKSNEEKTKNLIEKILDFGGQLFHEENGIENKINEAYKNVVNKYSDLFEPIEGEKSKITQLNENIDNINQFNQSLDKEIKPNLVNAQGYLDDLKIDINTKRTDIKSLLLSATLGALSQGYQEAKEEYSVKGEKKYKKSEKIVDIFSHSPLNLFVFLNNILFRYSSSVFNYIIFILPLLVICVIFLEPKTLENIFNYEALYGNGDGRLKGWEFLVLKVSISLPMLWVSWFGQRNISQRKRLFEEYNHKLRVVQMYVMFNDNEKSYNLDNKVKLERILLDVIKENPAKHLGKGETMIDQILEKFRMKGFYTELKEEILEELKIIIPTLSLKEEEDILEKMKPEDK